MKGFCYCFSPKGFAFPANAGRGLAGACRERQRLIGWAKGGRPEQRLGIKEYRQGKRRRPRLPQRWTVHEARARSPSRGSLGDSGLPSSINQCGLVRVMKGYCPRDCAEFPTTTHAEMLHEAHQPAHHPQHRIPGLGTGQRETWEPERTGPQYAAVNHWVCGVIGWSYQRRNNFHTAKLFPSPNNYF